MVEEHQREQPARLRFLGGEGEVAGEPGQRHLGGGCEVGVAAAKEQEEGVVALFAGGRPRLGVRRLLAAVTGGLAAAGVDEPPGRDRRQPRARVARRVLGPHPQRLQQRLQQRLLGGIEVLAPPDQPREHPREDRKSTRLNSSYVRISYAVFCLKKKNLAVLDAVLTAARQVVVGEG